MGGATGKPAPDGNPDQNAPGKYYSTEVKGAAVLGMMAVPAYAGVGGGTMAAGGAAGAGTAGAIGGGVAIGPVGWAALAVVGVGAVGVIGYKTYQNYRTRKEEEARAKAQAQTNVAVKGKDDQKLCPVCKQGPDIQAPPPAYLSPPRSPMAGETIPPLTGYKPTGMLVKGAKVYELPDGSYQHVDTFHKGPGSEIETYNSKGKHMGTICPRCGRPYPNSQVPGRTLPKN